MLSVAVTGNIIAEFPSSDSYALVFTLENEDNLPFSLRPHDMGAELVKQGQLNYETHPAHPIVIKVQLSGGPVTPESGVKFVNFTIRVSTKLLRLL